ncbi:U32 family peptidase [Patescibacteria group bacterium]|nr:U32 family peptidase [Patescibacteria group bacterium]MBU1721340.1 U32 family peptidase [Patescibacteria group bacterium]MBU1901625.1 U32 family peptidase [Patescibacteria group bacterium]
MPSLNGRMIEIMSPAGSWAALRAAVNAGANSVYFGVGQLNMRAKGAVNFDIKDLEEIASYCTKNDVKTYLTVNTILYNHDITLMKQVIDEAKRAGITAIIASDLSAIQYTHSIGMELHISTQCNISNIEAVKFFANFADVVVLARELPLQQIADICTAIKEENITGPSGKLVQVEVFAHGALCVAISGKCYMSIATENSSANRGACRQNCRHSYKVIDQETGDELVLENEYIMSPKDLCTVTFLDKILDSGVSVLKLEGRGRPAEYVDTVTRVYREAAEAYLAGEFTKEKGQAWTTELETVFNRGFWQGGYYLGKKLGEWSGVYGSKTTTKKILLGRISHYFVKAQVAECTIETNEVDLGDKLLITGPTTGVLYVTPEEIRLDDTAVKHAKKEDVISFVVPERVRKTDKVYIIKNKEDD